jgi:hypothetical protein
MPGKVKGTMTAGRLNGLSVLFFPDGEKRENLKPL